MIPRISFGVIVIAIVFYLIGARYPAIAARVGLA